MTSSRSQDADVDVEAAGKRLIKAAVGFFNSEATAVKTDRLLTNINVSSLKPVPRLHKHSARK